MRSKKELQIAYGLAAVLFVIGFLSYVAFPAKAPEVPLRTMFQSPAGQVLFDHQMHAAVEGYALSCQDCHHHNEEDEAEFRNCGACHLHPNEPKPAESACADCHEPDEVDFEDVASRPDAYHGQCGRCHDDIEAGPGTEDCNGCHVMQ